MLILLKILILLVSWFIICDINPNPGRIRIYTSGWPKNQKICWNIIGLPFPSGLKNIVLILISVRIIVIPLANTGTDRIKRMEVIMMAQENKLIVIIFLKTVVENDSIRNRIWTGSSFVKILRNRVCMVRWRYILLIWMKI